MRHAEQSPANEQVALLEARPKHRHPIREPELGRKGVAHRSYIAIDDRIEFRIWTTTRLLV